MTQMSRLDRRFHYTCLIGMVSFVIGTFLVSNALKGGEDGGWTRFLFVYSRDDGTTEIRPDLNGPPGRLVAVVRVIIAAVDSPLALPPHRDCHVWSEISSHGEQQPSYSIEADRARLTEFLATSSGPPAQPYRDSPAARRAYERAIALFAAGSSFNSKPYWPGIGPLLGCICVIVALGLSVAGIANRGRAWSYRRRGRLRLHAGLCPHCGYPPSDAPVCPECGVYREQWKSIDDLPAIRRVAALQTSRPRKSS
jgi:hypothetical protein